MKHILNSIVALLILSSNFAKAESLSYEGQENLINLEKRANQDGVFDGAIVLGVRGDVNLSILKLQGKVLALYDLASKKTDLYLAIGVGYGIPTNLASLYDLVDKAIESSGASFGVTLGYVGGKSYSRKSVLSAANISTSARVPAFVGASAGFSSGMGASLEGYCSYEFGCDLWMAAVSAEFGKNSKLGFGSIKLIPLRIAM